MSQLTVDVWIPVIIHADNVHPRLIFYVTCILYLYEYFIHRETTAAQIMNQDYAHTGIGMHEIKKFSADDEKQSEKRKR